MDVRRRPAPLASTSPVARSRSSGASTKRTFGPRVRSDAKPARVLVARFRVAVEAWTCNTVQQLDFSSFFSFLVDYLDNNNRLGRESMRWNGPEA